MIQLIIDLVTPILVDFGASAADVSSYLTSLSTYIYVILGSLLAMIVVMFAARFVKKGSRHVIRWTAAIAWVLVVLLVVNLVCYGPMNSIVSGFLNASKAEMSDDVVGNSKNVISQVGDEGMVLVKNNGLLPLASDANKLNVFGWSSVYPVYSGTGSANSGDAVTPPVGILLSLRDAGFSMNDELTKLYLGYRQARPTISMNSQDWTLPEPTREAYTDEMLANATAFSDTAIIVIGRSGGENADLPTDMNAVIHGTYDVAKSGIIDAKYQGNYGYTAGTYQNNGDYDDFEPGEHYLELSRTEEDLVEMVCSNFKDVIVVINANNAMELDWVDKYENIGAVILAPGTGNTGMAALGKILNGTVNPSGRTVDTYLKDLTLAPTYNHSGNSGNHIYTDTDDLVKKVGRNDLSFQGVFSFTDYVEGIYMGYKFYETAAQEGLIDYDAYVQYPFGYGLSYTTFEQKITDFKQTADALTVEVTVKNTGSVAGKDVVELYFTPPYTNGGIEKASVNLVDFAKTELLKPGASEKITFTVPLEELASYDSSCIKTAGGGYILEAGSYNLSIRSDSHTVLDSKEFEISADVDYSASGRPSDKTPAINLFDYVQGDMQYLSRKDGFANYETVTAPHTDFSMAKETSKAIEAISVAKYKPEKLDNENDVMPTLGADNGLKLADLTGKSYDDPMWEQLLDQMSLEDMIKLINEGGWKTASIPSVGKITTSDCDGPAGLSNYVTHTMGTQFPSEVLMAQTWNKELAEKIGAAIGQEFANAKNYGWYGPAMNLHRSAFSGRNYEYYSEDAVLSGKFASAEVNGAARYGVYAFIKHFAGNDQETNRCAFLLTYMTEQTLRENVLKPFETVVKNFDFDHYVMGMMTSYNWLGTVPTISNHELLTDVLRGEWGFIGTVISDYNGSYGFQISDAAVRAGNDLMLGYGMSESNKFEDTGAATLVLAMRQACKNILYTVGNSGYCADPTAVMEEEGADNMTRLFTTVNVSVCTAAALIELAVVVRWLLKRKKAKAA